MVVWRPIQHDSTDVSIIINIVDSATGVPETGVEHNTSGIDLEYRRDGATKVDITEAALAALDSAHADGGIEHIGGGAYRLDLPDEAVETGANGVWVGGSITDMVVIPTYVPLVPYNPYVDVIGTPAGASLAADIAAIEAQTDDIGAAGAGLTAITGVIGALDDAAADGAVTSVDTLVAYIKQLINTLEGAPGIPTFPAAAVAGNGVSLAEVIRSIDSRLPSALNNGVIPADVQRVNNVEVVGDGDATPWGPA